jgi:hypothetical protein
MADMIEGEPRISGNRRRALGGLHVTWRVSNA